MYAQYNDAKPDYTDNGTVFASDTKSNLLALRDAIVAGALHGWSVTAGGSDLSQPDTLTYAKGVERIRASITWISSGPADGSPDEILYEYSDNSGVDWVTIGTKTFSYDAGGDFTGAAWS